MSNCSDWTEECANRGAGARPRAHGSIENDPGDAYGHAFVILALTTAGCWSGARDGGSNAKAIRTMHRYAARHEAAELAEPLRQSIAFVRRHFVDDEYGGWDLNPPGIGGEPSLAKGNAWKLDFHVVNKCRELLAG
jgi:mannose/cellobiose epimerase-like protein (N-acyl-D-glucosamine 2-epimerase family)